MMHSADTEGESFALFPPLKDVKVACIMQGGKSASICRLTIGKGQGVVLLQGPRYSVVSLMVILQRRVRLCAESEEFKSSRSAYEKEHLKKYTEGMATAHGKGFQLIQLVPLSIEGW